MDRRKKTEEEIKTKGRKNNRGKFRSIPAAKSVLGSKKQSKPRHDLRFGVSLVILIAVLSSATYLLLFAFAGAQNIFPSRQNAVAEKNAGTVKNAKAKPPVNAKKLDDKSLDYQLAFSPQFGEWIYKIGYVVSPTNETLTNQYAKIYVPLASRSNSSNFEEKYFSIITIRKYTEKEWGELEKGCEKGNTLYCEQKGERMGSKDGSVYSYIASENCPRELLGRCKAVESIMKSFQLN